MEYENKAKDAENRGDYLSAIRYYLQAVEALQEMELIEGFEFDSGTILQRVATLYTEIGDMDSAITYFNQASNLFVESNESLTKIYRLAGECQSRIGACYLTGSNYEAASKYFHKAVEYLEKATELEDEVLRRYVAERTILNLALMSLCSINLNKPKGEITPLLEKANNIKRLYNVRGLASNLILFFGHIITEKFTEARIVLKEGIEEAADSFLFSSTLQAAVTGLISDLMSKHIPEARIQIKDKIIEEKGEVIFTTKKLYEDLLLHALTYANAKMPKSEYKEVYGLIVGKIEKDNVIITEMIPMASGTDVEVEFKEEHYIKAETISTAVAERNGNEFIVGWYHTHPGLGLFLSPTDIINQLGYQTLNDKAIAVVFDFTQSSTTNPGFLIFRLDDASLGQASNYHRVRWRIKDASKEVFAESFSFFDKFLIQLNTFLLKNRHVSLTQLAETFHRSEMLFSEILPQLVALQYLPNTYFNPQTKVLSLKA